MFYIDLSAKHSLAAANAHYYKKPTEERYIDRVLPYHDLIYLIEGGWSFTEQEQEYTLVENDVLLLASGRHHYSKSPCLPNTRTFCLHISCESGDTENAPGSTMLPTCIHIQQNTKIKEYFNEIVSTYWLDTTYKEIKLQALVDLLLVSLYEEHQQSYNKNDLASKAIQIITDTPHKRFQTKEIADMLFVSTKTLNNAMNQKIGMPFYAYQKKQKLEMIALQLETEPELKLQELALSFGFHDEFHLSKAFKQHYGVSPNEYRKNPLLPNKL